MLKNISNLGTTLNRREQQSINGGTCSDTYNHCDRLYPESHSKFSACMDRGGCGGNTQIQMV